MNEAWVVTGFLAGLALLSAGAHVFLAGAAGAARRLGMSPYLIGVTVVGFGTSAPELAVNVSAALEGADAITLGNVIGSNIANVGLILGLCALLSPLDVHMRLLRFEGPVMVGAAAAFWILASDGWLSRADGILLLVGFAAFTFYLYRSARLEPSDVQEELRATGESHARVASAAWRLVVGLVCLVGGAELMVRAGAALARGLGISELVIGLTIVAVGTSLPELASSLLAAKRGDGDIAAGNVLGSNIFNIVLILGLTVVIHPMAVPTALLYADLPVLLVFSTALMLVMRSSLRITRAEGGLLLCAYVVFTLLQSTRPG